MTWRVMLLYDTKGWAYHKRCLALQRYAELHEPDFYVEIAESVRADPTHWVADHHDLVMQLCYGRATETRDALLHRGHRARLVVGVNVGWCPRGKRLPTDRMSTQERIEVAGYMADAVVVNSRLTYEAATAAGLPVDWISNGVRRDHFPVTVPIERRPTKVLWTGSRFHRITKNYDTILVPLKERLESEGIPCDFRLVDSHGEKWSTSRMAEWYNTGSVYVCASRYEGTPNPALEAASCGCTVVSTPVGNMPELIQDRVNGRLCDFTLNSLASGVRDAVRNYERYAAAMQETIAGWDWMTRGREYFDLFRRLLVERGIEPSVPSQDA